MADAPLAGDVIFSCIELGRLLDLFRDLAMRAAAGSAGAALVDIATLSEVDIIEVGRERASLPVAS